MSFRILGTLALTTFVLACGKPSPGKDAGIQWPPTDWWTETTCALPACDSTAAAVPFDATGNWKITLTTTSSDCNATIQGLDDRLKVGNVHSGQMHPLNLAGTCDYGTIPDGGTYQDGTYHNASLITCEVTQRLQSVMEVDVSTVDFVDGGTASGKATAYFSNWPTDVGQTGNKCQAQFDVAMTRSP